MNMERSYELRFLRFNRTPDEFPFGYQVPSPFPRLRFPHGDSRANSNSQVPQTSPQNILIAFNNMGSNESLSNITSPTSNTEESVLSINLALACLDIEKLMQIFRNKSNLSHINEPDASGHTPLHIAARLNNGEAASILLQNGASINCKSGNGDAPIHTALRHKSSAVFKVLIDHGATLTITDKTGATPLHIACMKAEQSDVALLLSVTKEIINFSDQFRMKPIHYAALGGHPSICDILIKYGADPMEAAGFGATALMLATNSGRKDVMQLILKKVREQQNFSPSSIKEFVNMKTKDGRTALHWAALVGNSEAVKLLLENGAVVNEGSKDSRFPLHFAASSPNTVVVKQLIASGAFLEPRDDHGRTPLHYAAMGGTEESIRCLISAGAQADPKATNGYTPLYFAVLKIRIVIVKTLLELGASPFLEDANNKTCLHHAVDVNSIHIIEELISSSGYALNYARDSKGQTAMHYAAFLEKPKIMVRLIEKSSMQNPKDLEGKTPLHIAAENGSLRCIETLLEGASSELINSQDTYGDTPLHSAIRKRHDKVCEMLVAAGADVNKRNKNGQTPLHIANSCEDRHIVLKKLLITDADPENKDNKGDTPLITAVKVNNVIGVKLLLDSGASLSTTNSNGHNALEASIEKGQEETCMAILQHPRWKEALTDDSYRQQTILWKMIEAMPKAVGIVLDKSISFSEHHASHPDLKFTYDFGYLEPTPEVMKSKKVYTILPTKMVNYSREELLLHPVTKQFLIFKWKTLGRYLYYASFLLYVFYLITMSYLLIIENDRNIAEMDYIFLTSKNAKQSPLKLSTKATMQFTIGVTPFPSGTKQLPHQMAPPIGAITPSPSIQQFLTSKISISSKAIQTGRGTGTSVTFRTTVKKPEQKPSEGGLGKVLGGFTLSFAIIMLVKEIVQMYFTGMNYLKDFSNYIEVILYSFSIFYLLEFLVKVGWENSNAKYQLGIVTLVFIYLNMLLYLQRVTIFKLYIVMFMQVVMTLLRVFMVFSVAVLGFAITFYQMFPKQDTYSSVAKSLVKVLVMLTGELDYDSVMTSNLNKKDSETNYQLVPFVDLSYIILVVFLLILCIGLMNLLVGLAVGDIQTIRRHAQMQAGIQDVEFTQEMYNSIPNMICENIYKRKIEIYPNRLSLFSRIAARFNDKDEAEKAQKLIVSIRHRTEEMKKQGELLEFKTAEKQRLQTLEQDLYKQGVLVQQIAKKLDCFN